MSATSRGKAAMIGSELPWRVSVVLSNSRRKLTILLALREKFTASQVDPLEWPDNPR